MPLSKAEQKAKMEQLAQLVENNDITGLTQILKEFETKLSGHERWEYQSPEYYVECAVRDALLAGKKEIAELFFDAGVSLDYYAFMEGNKGDIIRLMHFAVKSGKLEMVELMVERGATIRSRYKGGSNNNFGLKSAVHEGHTDIAKYLLARGAEADSVFGYEVRGAMHGGLPLIAKAALDGNVRLVESLLKHGAQIKPTFILAHEKLYKKGICEYNTRIQSGYSSKARIAKLKYAFDVLLKNSSKFRFNGELTVGGRAFFEKLNEQLLNLDALENSKAERDKFIVNFTLQLGAFGIAWVDEKHILKELENLIPSLRMFDDKKRELEQKRDQLVNVFTSMIKILMDYAMGCDFDNKEMLAFRDESRQLQLLEGIDVSGVNFIGVSLDGEPITYDILRCLNVKGAEHAIVTVTDLNVLSDAARINTLSNLLKQTLRKNGEVTDAHGVFNFIPLTKAAEIGNETVVRTRLLAGVDPHENSPLIAAAKRGHLDIVKILMASLAYHATHKITQLIAKAEELLAVPQEATAVCVQEGRIKRVLVPFTNASYLPVTTSDDYMEFALLSKFFKNSTLHLEIEQAMAVADSKGMNCICIIQHGLALQTFFYSKDEEASKVQELLDDCIKKTDLVYGGNYFPLMFTNKTNHDVIHRLIETQYKEIIESGKKSIKKAIKVAREEKHHAVAEYLESQQDVNTVNKQGDTQLHRAVKTGDLKRVHELVSRGADVNIINKEGKTAIAIAALNCSWYEDERSLVYFYILKCLLDNKAKVDVATLTAAMRAGSVGALTLLLPRAALEDVSYSYSGHDGKPQMLTKPWYSDLMYEALGRKNSIRLLKLLKEYGADFNRRDDNRVTLLSDAVNNLSSIESIVKAMNDFRSTSVTMRAIFNALIESDQQIFEKELRILNYLLDNGADPRCTDHDGSTPLYNLILNKDLRFLPDNGYEVLLDKFLAKGADVNAANEQNSTPLHAAARTGDIAAVIYLIMHQAKVDASDDKGNTPLHDAVESGLLSSFDALVVSGASITASNNKGQTPYDVLESSNNEKKKALLDRYAKALQERAKESPAFFSQRDSLEEVHRYYREKLEELHSSYLKINLALVAATINSHGLFGSVKS